MPNPQNTDFQFLAENSIDLICRVDCNSIIRYASPSSLRLLGWTPEELIGSGPDKVVLPEDLHVIAAASAHAHSPGVRSAPATVRARRKDGTIIWIEISATITRDPVTDEPGDAVLVMRDITERKLMEARLSTQALTDGLTGLANRRAFDQALEKEWKRTLREGSQMSLIILDIDHFKNLNDHYGHQFGDDCLRAIATAVSAAASRAIDLVARYGGEELAVILPSTGAAGALIIAERVRTAIEDLRIPHPGNHQPGGVVTASIGVATALARHGGLVKMPESLLTTADAALYRAKHTGRNRVEACLLLTSQDTPQMAY